MCVAMLIQNVLTLQSHPEVHPPAVSTTQPRVETRGLSSRSAGAGFPPRAVLIHLATWLENILCDWVLLRSILFTCVVCWLLFFAAGCANYGQTAPVYRENVALSNQNAQLQDQVKTLRQQVSDLKEQLAAQTPRISALPPDRRAELFTVDSINITGDTRSTHIGGAEKLNG